MTPQEYDILPNQVKDVLSTFNENNDLYLECKKLAKKLKAIGYNIDYDLSGTITEIKDIYIRRCYKTNRPIIKDGFCVFDGEIYFLEEKDLIEFLRNEIYPTIKKDSELLDHAYSNGVYYWTEWETNEIYNY